MGCQLEYQRGGSCQLENFEEEPFASGDRFQKRSILKKNVQQDQKERINLGTVKVPFQMSINFDIWFR
ncbi:hypothetical protein M0802_011482 [Mischocyttarus mexicanus]|nr:hypothetical protein M0802_011482 [Mischocyttarus mexicanus]